MSRNILRSRFLCTAQDDYDFFLSKIIQNLYITDSHAKVTMRSKRIITVARRPKRNYDAYANQPSEATEQLLSSMLLS